MPPSLTRPHTPRPAAEAGQASAGRRKRTPGIASIRERLVVTILLLTFFGIGMSGAVAYVLQWARIQSQAYAQLSRDASDFRDLAYLNIDPGTGKPFTDVSDLLRGALQSKTLSESGGILGISDGKVVWKANSSVTVRPENDPAFVALVLDKSKLSNVTTERYTSGSTDYAYLVVPVSWIYTGETGALVRVVDLSIERKALNETFVTYALVGVGAIAVTAVITWLVMARLLQPISWLQRTAEEITEHDLKRRIPVRGNDDLAALTTTVNGMLDRLESTVEAQKSLLDDVGHELRTPMTIVRGHLELMDTTDPKDAEVVRTLALEELARMSSLVNDLILLAQSERSDFVVLQDVDAGRLTDETFEKVRVLGDRHWIMDSLADTSVMMDPQRNHPGLAPARGERREVLARRHGHRHRQQARGRQRTALDTRPRHGLHRGRQGVRARAFRTIAPRGCEAYGQRGPRTRYCELDCVGAWWSSRYRLGPRPREHREPRHSTPACDGARLMNQILIVEDEERIAAFLAKGLRAAGFPATTEASGVAGAHKALSGEYDLMILDVGLPDVNGFEVLRRVRAQGSRIPVIMLTARSSVTDTVKGLEYGADDYIAKPFRFEELVARVRRRLRRESPSEASLVLQHGKLKLDLRTHKASLAGHEVDSPPASSRSSRPS
ncbi:MAG TPA: response regulator [Propionibacteriaceae bacterium]